MCMKVCATLRVSRPFFLCSLERRASVRSVALGVACPCLARSLPHLLAQHCCTSASCFLHTLEIAKYQPAHPNAAEGIGDEHKDLFL
jgi:hypothetical protein